MPPIQPVSMPAPRGPLSSWLFNRLLRPTWAGSAPDSASGSGMSDDLQLALYVCYELHYSELPGVDPRLEWDTDVLAFRRGLEARFEQALTAAVGPVTPVSDAGAAVQAVIDSDDGPSMSRFMETEGTLDQMRQFLIHRSAYQLKEGDPHTFAIPRLHGRAKQLLVEIQAGEYGADAPDRRMHSDLFAQTMRSVGLDDRRNAHLAALPASALMISNLISLFALNRRWRGALVGHLALFEMTSVVPMGRYSRGLERMGASADARRFYDVHILADAEHEVMALEMVRALTTDEPQLAGDVVFGARCVCAVETRFADDLLRAFAVDQQRVVSAA